MVHCDFCGYDFDPSCSEQSCSGCPLQKSCSKLTCPRCGYPVLPEAKLITWIKRTITSKKTTKELNHEN